MGNVERNKVIPSVFLLLKRDSKLLLQRRFGTGFQDGQYTLVSGHVDQGEPPTVAICREAKEEAGIDVKPEDVRLEQVLYRRSFLDAGNGYDPSRPERIDFFFSTDKWQGEPQITEPNKCDDLSWFPLGKLPENIFLIAKAFLDEYPNQPIFKESGY